MRNTKKIKADENGDDYMLFRTDVCFSEYNLAVEVMKKDILIEIFFFEKKRQGTLKKNLIVNSTELILVKKIMM